MDYLSSYLYFYYYRIFELQSRENELRKYFITLIFLYNIRSELYEAYRSACIHKDEIGQVS